VIEREGSIVEVKKIDPNSTHIPPENRKAKNGVVSSLSRKPRSEKSNQTAISKDTVALNSQAIDMSSLESRIEQLPNIDAARVVELHNRIIANEYKIDSERLASEIIDLESSLNS